MFLSFTYPYGGSGTKGAGTKLRMHEEISYLSETMQKLRFLYLTKLQSVRRMTYWLCKSFWHQQ